MDQLIGIVCSMLYIVKCVTGMFLLTLSSVSSSSSLSSLSSLSLLLTEAVSEVEAVSALSDDLTSTGASGAACCENHKVINVVRQKV